MTVMFVDLVGSTDMSVLHEPEIVRDVTRRYQEIAARVTGEHDGFVAQYAGDAILIYFGYPAAQEDDARRAVVAALELRDGIRELATEVRREHGVELAARIGLHTGVVLRGDMGSPDAPAHDMIVGLTPNQAARVETSAPAGEVAISDATAEVVRGYFELESLGHPEMKGVPAGVELFRVVRATQAADRLQAARGSLTPLVGRTQELVTLRELWDAVAAPRADACAVRTVAVRGEAGIGKSRLVLALADEALEGGHTVFTGRCARDRAGSPLFPIVGLLASHLGVDPGADDAARLASIVDAVRAAGLDSDAASLFAELLAIPEAAGYQRLQLSATARRARLFDALVALVSARARERRALVIIEDLHWVDGTTIDLLSAMTAATPAGGLLLAITMRPVPHPPWTGPCHATIQLGPLPGADQVALIRALAEIYAIDKTMWPTIAERSDGNPLFAEELAKSIGRATDGSLATETIPTTIRDLLTARLDALGDTKRLAQIAAVIGRDVDDDLLQTVAGASRRQVASGLAQLVAAGIMQDAVGDHAATHRFAHALVHDAAYDSQERLRDRRDAHLRVAKALRDRPGADAGIVALHFDRANVPDDARRYYQKAAASAQETAADVEAIRYLERALELTVEMPEGAVRDAAELAIRIQRGLSTVNLQGYASPNAADDYRRALDLSERLADDVALFPATAGIWAYYAVHGDLHAAAEAIDRLSAMQVADFTEEVSSCAGVQHFFEGRFTDATTEFEQAIAGFGARADDAKPAAWWSLPNDPLVAALTHDAVLQWLGGEQAAADEQFARANRRAADLSFATGPFSTAYTISYQGWLANLIGRYEEARALHERVIGIGEQYGLVFWTATGTCHWAISRGHLGEPDLAIEILEAAIEQWRALGAETFVPCFRTQLAEIRLGLEQCGDALADVERAIEQAERTGEEWFAAESHRVRGAILNRMDPDDATRALDAVDTAQRLAARQGALMFELRAAADAVELVADVDRGARRAALRKVVERLPGGAAGPGVARAKALLASAS